MEYELFKKKVKESVEALCPDCDGVTTVKVAKNSALSLDALVLRKEGVNLAPAYYLNDYYEKYCGGMDIEAIAKDIAAKFAEAPEMSGFSREELSDFELIKDRIAYRPIGTAENDARLKNIPHRELLDMSVIYFCCMENEEADRLTAMTVLDSHIRSWGIDEAELYRLACVNTKRLLPTVIKSMPVMLDELSGAGRSDGEPEGVQEAVGEEQMYVASNERRVFGAASLLDNEALEAFAKEHGDFYIVPSSVHEILLVPENSGVDVKTLQNMLDEANASYLGSDEVLSDSLYRYDSSQHSVAKINKINS